jgi:putative proteasome-type protease
VTYCVGLLMDAGLVLLSDTRTNAGVDQVSTFRKMAVFDRPGERVLVLLSSGNLAVTQSLVGVLRERCVDAGPNLWTVRDMFEAARHVGDVLREIHARDAPALAKFNIEFVVSFLLGGQIRGEAPRLFQVYAAGNFIEASPDTPYLQIGESKYGKPILDRVFTWQSSLEDATKCALVSMDSTLRSNLSVGMPLDLLCYARGSLRVERRLSIDADNPYFNTLRRQWGEHLRQGFREIPALDMEHCVGRGTEGQ